MAKAKKEETEGGITAYSVKTKTKNVPMVDPVINVKSGRFIAVGKDADGNNMAAILGKAKAEEHIKNGQAKKGEGWEK
jgi:ABC-type hemin transport system substrate-binding protein